jgi:hypothetical protein
VIDNCGPCVSFTARGPEQAPTRLHIGRGQQAIPGWIKIDNKALPGVDRVLDVRQGLPFRGASAIYAEHFLEYSRVRRRAPPSDGVPARPRARRRLPSLDSEPRSGRHTTASRSPRPRKGRAIVSSRTGPFMAVDISFSTTRPRSRRLSRRQASRRSGFTPAARARSPSSSVSNVTRHGRTPRRCRTS